MGSSPGDSDCFSYYEFFLSLSFLPVDSAKKACVHSGKEVADTLPAIKMPVSTAQGGENGCPQGEEPCDVTMVQMFRQDASVAIEDSFSFSAKQAT